MKILASVALAMFLFGWMYISQANGDSKSCYQFGSTGIITCN
jgi:hypothetical protein